jgi:hypothetical protein
MDDGVNVGESVKLDDEFVTSINDGNVTREDPPCDISVTLAEIDLIPPLAGRNQACRMISRPFTTPSPM